jgi:flagellar basal-body rod protein FlgB
MLRAFVNATCSGFGGYLMASGVTAMFSVEEKVLALRGYRQQLLASNIANADTPNYKAVDIDFSKVLAGAGGSGGSLAMTRTSARHLDGGAGSVLAGVKPQYRNAVQPSVDGNTVDTNIEQAQFTENALQYSTTMQFLNDRIKNMRLALGN